jgi:hypothetical protein
MGPVCVRELVTAARRWRTYGERYEFALALALLSGGVMFVWWYGSPGVLASRTMGRIAQQVFGLTVAAQAIVLLSMVPQSVARGLAGERDKNTLNSLLATTLSSRTIVLDVLIATFARHGCWLLVGLPLMLMLTTFGGVDPRLVVLSYLSIGTLCFALAGLALVVSAGAAGRKQAAHRSSGLAGVWLVWPMMLAPLAARYIPALWRWIAPVNDWLRASSPMVIVFDVIASASWARIERDLLWMMGLQVAAGVALTTWAIIRLRPASRRLEERQGATSARRLRMRAGILHRRPPCGDDPMLWKEMHTGQPRTWSALLMGLIVIAIFASLVILLGIYLAAPAFWEWRGQGFRSTGAHDARGLIGLAVRAATGTIAFIYMLLLTGQGAEAIAVERAKDTWTSLLTTSLEGREILRAKRLGVAWRSRVLIVLIAVLWLMGLGTGSIHPFGVAASALALWAMVDLATACGVYCSLISKDAAQATNRAVLPATLLACSGLLPFLMPAGFASILEGVLSLPLSLGIALVSPWEVREAIEGRWVSPIGPITLRQENPAIYVASYLLTLAFGFATAAILRRLAEQRFDRAAGRPQRAAREPEPTVHPGRAVLTAESVA